MIKEQAKHNFFLFTDYSSHYGEWCLRIRRLAANLDQGVYDVRAENRHGSSERSWSLRVEPRPRPQTTIDPEAAGSRRLIDDGDTGVIEVVQSELLQKDREKVRT